MKCVCRPLAPPVVPLFAGAPIQTLVNVDAAPWVTFGNEGAMGELCEWSGVSTPVPPLWLCGPFSAPVSACVSSPVLAPSGRAESPAPDPEMAIALPNVFGRVIRQFAAHAADAAPCAALVVAPPPLVRIGAHASARLYSRL